MEPIIQFENLSKCYTLRHQTPQRYVALRDVIADAARSAVRRLSSPFRAKQLPRAAEREEFWALKEVSFSIKEGERVGIIGRNGAGKSTLLKVLSRITEPTSGRVRLKGRVASLLEVGTGFHPELTGRENIYLNGAILGMTKAEIRRKFDEIVAFAEVERFLDTPVKYYSSGMYVRLAFSVAAHLEPEILVVDEVLAVGDVAFQNKCLGKMENVATEGRTVLFVSHNMGAIRRLCSRCVVLNGGQVITDEAPDSAIKQYTTNVIRRISEYSQPENKNKPINLRKVRLLTKSGIESPESCEIEYADGFALQIEYEVHHAIRSSIIWASIWTVDGTEVMVTADYDRNEAVLQERKPGYYKTGIIFPGDLLNTGDYYIVVGIASYEPVAVSYDRVEAVYMSIIDSQQYALEERAIRSGLIKPSLLWSQQ